jgi:excinuclease ABC subunit C
VDLVADPARNREEIRAHAPRLPGVYGMVDGFGELIYVGMSIQLRDRLLTYFTKGPEDAKERRVAKHASRLVWEVGDHEFIVRLRELELIRRWRPRYNAHGKPERREIGYIYLALSEAPCFRLGRRPPKSCRHQWGPVPASRRMRAAVKRLNLFFKLRDCPAETPIHYADQPALFLETDRSACMRGDLGTCLAPCAAGCAQREYAAQIDSALQLLDGRDRPVVDELESAMKEAASNCEFERAAALRDTWQQLAFVRDQLDLLRSVRRDYWFVYPVANRSGSASWALITGGNVAAVVPEPSSRASARLGLTLLENTFLSSAHKQANEDFDQVRLVASWFRQRGDELQRVLEPAQAIKSCHAWLNG